MNAKVWSPGGILEWHQPGSERQGFVLMSGGEEAARLTVNGWRVSQAQGESAFGRWVFRKEGFWRPRYLIREEGTEIDVAEFFMKWHWSRGRIAFQTGKEFFWKTEGMFTKAYVVSDEAGAIILRLREGLGKSFWKDLFKQQGRLELGTPAVDPRMLSVLALICWHLVLMLRQRRAAASSA